MSKHSLVIPSNITNLLPVNQIQSFIPSAVFFIHITTFSVFWLQLKQLFSNVLLTSNSKWVQHFQNTKYSFSLSILHLNCYHPLHSPLPPPRFLHPKKEWKRSLSPQGHKCWWPCSVFSEEGAACAERQHCNPLYPSSVISTDDTKMNRKFWLKMRQLILITEVSIMHFEFGFVIKKRVFRLKIQ